MNLHDLASLFHRLGLKRPKHVFIPFGEWSEEGIELESEDEERAREVAEALVGERKPCTCCECYFEIGPPGCDGTDCHNCGREH